MVLTFLATAIAVVIIFVHVGGYSKVGKDIYQSITMILQE